MEQQTPIVSAERVTVEKLSPLESTLRGLSFTVAAGEMMLARMVDYSPTAPLGDVITGLREPASGVVKWMGKDWQRLSADKSAAQRGHIGRTFAEGGWISNLNIDENVMLRPMHHGKRPAAEIVAEMTQLAQRFGLKAVPAARAHTCSVADLRRSALVRALLDQPRMVVLEGPTDGVFADLTEPLMAAVAEVRGRGGAVVWMTTDPRVWAMAGKSASQAWEIRDQQMIPAPPQG